MVSAHTKLSKPGRASVQRSSLPVPQVVVSTAGASDLVKAPGTQSGEAATRESAYTR